MQAEEVKKTNPIPRSTVIVRRVLYTLGILVVFVLCFYAFENWRWNRAWDEYRSIRIDSGNWSETATDLAPPLVPDDQNFATTPLLRPLFNYDPDKRYSNRWHDQTAYDHVSGMIPYRSTMHRTLFRHLRGHWQRMKPTDYEALGVYARGHTNFPPASLNSEMLEDYRYGMERKHGITNTNLPFAEENQPPGNAILQLVSGYQSELDELSDALHRPYSRFPIHYHEQVPDRILQPHLTTLIRISRLFCLRGCALLKTGNTKGALQDLLRIYTLADTVSNEPFTASHIVRFAIQDIGHHVLWEGMRMRSWSVPDLLTIKRRLDQTKTHEPFLRAVAGERYSAKATADHLAQTRPSRDVANMFYAFSDPVVHNSFMLLAPSGWFTANALDATRYVDAIEEFVIARKPFKDTPDADEIILSDNKSPYYSVFLSGHFGSLYNVVARLCQAESHLSLARTACALELYHSEFGKYPDILETLVPVFLNSLPIDQADGNPLRFLRTEDDRYCIYSVGRDLNDDKGNVSIDSYHTYRGDWTWSYSARHFPREPELNIFGEPTDSTTDPIP